MLVRADSDGHETRAHDDKINEGASRLLQGHAPSFAHRFRFSLFLLQSVRQLLLLPLQT